MYNTKPEWMCYSS